MPGKTDHQIRYVLQWLATNEGTMTFITLHKATADHLLKRVQAAGGDISRIKVDIAGVNKSMP